MPSRVRLRPVKIYNGHPRLRFNRAAIAAVIHALDAGAAAATDCGRGTWCLPAGEFSLAFLTEAALARLHADFMDDPAPTDVITFPGNAAQALAGEVCISADAAQAYAQRHGREFAEELTLYLVHGYLHLGGYDDRTPATRRQMRTAEQGAMANLRAARKLPAFSFQSVAV